MNEVCTHDEIRNKLRRWSAAALSHNTVVVDGKEQDGGDTFGNVLLYEPNLAGLSAIQVDGAKADREAGVSRYRRTIILNKDELVYNWWMPHLIARREGNGPLCSRFVAVYDLFRNGPQVDCVEQLPAEEDVVALRIDVDGRTDTVLFVLNGPKTMEAGGVRMHGRLGVVCRRDGKSNGYLVGGEFLTSDTLKFRQEPAEYRGTIHAATRRYDGDPHDFFLTPTALPPGTALHGSWMIVTHPGSNVTHAYEIDRIERSGNQSRIALTADHGLRIEGDTTRELFSRWRTFRGKNTFVIQTHAMARH